MTAELKRLLAFERYRNLAILQTLQEIKMTHTPGPWEADDDNSFIHAKNGKVYVAQANHARDVDLIAAAPEMLAALKSLIDCHDCEDGQLNLAVVNKGRAAIAKAEGRQ